MNVVKQKLKAYSEKLGLYSPMSLDSLIDSHYNLREEFKNFRVQEQKMFRKLIKMLLNLCSKNKWILRGLNGKI